MNLKNIYWYFKSELSADFCNKIIEHGNSKREKLAMIGDYAKKEKISKKDEKNLKKKRNSNVAFLDDQWIYQKIVPIIETANRNSGWNFEISYYESIQFTKYKLNQFYSWHCDPFPEPYNKPNFPDFHGKIRKLSAVVQLSDPKDYKGGNFEIQPRSAEKANYKINVKEFKPKGSVLVFPSHLWHRVKPVTKGVRYSLVIWCLGYPFK
jgi:PKHD-type hydroxylase